MNKITIAGIFLCIGALIGAVAAWTLQPEPVAPDPVITTVTEYKTVWKTEPKTECEKAPIRFSHTLGAGKLSVYATDGCKSAAYDIGIECPAPPTDWKGYGIAGTIGFAAGVVLCIVLGGGSGS